MKRACGVSLALICLLSLTVAWGADSPQFRGTNRDGKFLDTGLLKQWPEGGPKLLWSVDGLGGGWSSASAANGSVYVTGMDAQQQGQLFAFDAAGKLKWQAPYGAEDKGGGHPGARTTPTVDGDRVWVMSSTGHLVSFEAATGKKLLDIDTLDRFKGVQPQWSIAESPLIDGERVICTPGGPDASIVALNKNTGDTVWTTKGLGAPSGFCSANLISVGNRKLIVTQVKGLVVGVDAENGQPLWQYPVANKMGIQPDTPVYADGMLYVNGGRGVGGAMLQLSADGSSFTEKWTDKTLTTFHHGIVLLNGYIYATDSAGKQLTCLELATGKMMWQAPATGMACLVYADGMLYAFAENGNMQLIKADPQAFTPVSSFMVTKGSGEFWSHPTIANGVLYLRHGDSMMAYDIKAAQ